MTDEEAESQEYNLEILKADDTGRHVETVTYRFTVRPDFEVTGFELYDVVDKTSKELEMDEEDKENALKSIKEWLFEKEKSPVSSKSNLIWNYEPEFSDEDKQKIKRLYLMEEV